MYYHCISSRCSFRYFWVSKDKTSLWRPPLITNGHESNVKNLNPPHRSRHERKMGFKVQSSNLKKKSRLPASMGGSIRICSRMWQKSMYNIYQAVLFLSYFAKRIDGPCSFDSMNIDEPPSTYTSDHLDSCEIDHFLHMHFLLVET